jgi:hypothetical protein
VAARVTPKTKEGEPLSDDRPTQPPIEAPAAADVTGTPADESLVTPAELTVVEAPPPPPDGATPEATTFGPCLKCRAQVNLAETFRVGGGKANGIPSSPGMRMHRLGTLKKTQIGEVCGPVAEALIFHVVYQVAGRHLDRARLAAPQSPEENYEVLDMWEDALSREMASRFKAVDKETGQPILGAAPAKIPVVVTTWKFIGAM